MRLYCSATLCFVTVCRFVTVFCYRFVNVPFSNVPFWIIYRFVTYHWITYSFEIYRFVKYCYTVCTYISIMSRTYSVNYEYICFFSDISRCIKTRCSFVLAIWKYQQIGIIIFFSFYTMINVLCFLCGINKLKALILYYHALLYHYWLLSFSISLYS
jgi:hypothetical protein